MNQSIITYKPALQVMQCVYDHLSTPGYLTGDVITPADILHLADVKIPARILQSVAHSVWEGNTYENEGVELSVLRLELNTEVDVHMEYKRERLFTWEFQIPVENPTYEWERSMSLSSFDAHGCIDIVSYSSKCIKSCLIWDEAKAMQVVKQLKRMLAEAIQTAKVEQS